MNLMFIEAGNIVLLVVLFVILISMPIMMSRRNKKEQEKQRELINTLKVGEYVLTYSGIFGKVSEIIEKETGKYLVIETGEAKKCFVTVSENAIYMIVNNNPKIYSVDGEVIPQEETEEAKETEETEVEEKKEVKKSKNKKK